MVFGQLKNPEFRIYPEKSYPCYIYSSVKTVTNPDSSNPNPNPVPNTNPIFLILMDNAGMTMNLIYTLSC